MNTLWGREPALIMGLTTSGIAMAIGFGLDWTGEQQALVTAFAAALLSVVTRSRVSPYHVDEGAEDI